MAQIYRFCPLCATPLEPALRFDQIRPTCPRCGFIHFQDPKVAVIARVTYDGKVLLVRRAVDPGRGMWSLPGGFMDAGEMPDGALRRELQEEVGLEIEVGESLGIFPLVDMDGDRVGIVLAFAAWPTGSPALQGAADDVSEAGWFAPDRIPEPLAFESTQRLLEAWQRALHTSSMRKKS